jgi:hypothetical protein
VPFTTASYGAPDHSAPKRHFDVRSDDIATARR